MSQKKNKSNERGSAETITTVRQCMAMRQMSENNKRSCPRLRLVNRSKDGNIEAGKDKIEGNQDKINGKIGAYRQFTTVYWIGSEEPGTLSALIESQGFFSRLSMKSYLLLVSPSRW